MKDEKKKKTCHEEHDSTKDKKTNGSNNDGNNENENDNKDKILRRLKLIEGQIRGLYQMIEKDTYCIDVITQTSAVKQGLSNVEDLLLEHHLGHCVLRQVAQGQTEKAKEEILKVYKLKRK